MEEVKISQEEIKELLANQRTMIAQMEVMGKENAELKKQHADGMGISRVLKPITDHVVELRFLDNKAVLAFKNRSVSEDRPTYIYTKPDPKNPRDNIEYVDLIMEGSDKVLSVNFKEFRSEALRVKCKVIQTDTKEWKINQGLVRKKEIEAYSMVELDFDVPLDIIGVTRFFKVEVPAGNGGKESRELTIHERYVNIA